MILSVWFGGPPASDGDAPRSRERRPADSASDSFDPADPDIAVLAQIRAGDEHAFATLFTKYVDVVSAFAYRYVGSADSARDITQEVFIRVWERRALIPRSGVRAYLLRAARNRALDLLGHETVVARWQAAQLGDDDRTHAVNAGALSVDADEIATRVHAALATLTPRAREIVRLVREDGLKPGEVATLLGLTPATVYVHLSRALRQLATLLRE